MAYVDDVREFMKELYVEITPKLGGGGLSPSTREAIRMVAWPALTDEQRDICGRAPPSQAAVKE